MAEGGEGQARHRDVPGLVVGEGERLERTITFVFSTKPSKAEQMTFIQALEKLCDKTPHCEGMYSVSDRVCSRDIVVAGMDYPRPKWVSEV